VSAVECRCDEHAPYDWLDASGKIELSVFEKGCDAEDELEEEHAFRRHTEEHDRRETNGNGEKELSRMEAQSQACSRAVERKHGCAMEIPWTPSFRVISSTPISSATDSTGSA
jgi:hypothetical protein